jgi:bisphosphoglycerate-dependent phosphoglycerate mutase
MDPDDEALRAVAERISLRREELARRTTDRFRAEIVGWQMVDESCLASAHQFTLRNIDALLSNLGDDEPLGEELLEQACRAATCWTRC